jgi:FKBP-type peptidyl-prolyl cis-trans isomerase FklB
MKSTKCWFPSIDVESTTHQRLKQLATSPSLHPNPMKLFPIALSAILLLTGCETDLTTSKPPSSSAPSSAPLPMQTSQPAAPTVDSDGVTTMPSGLRYKVLASGPADGRSPTLFDSVVVHYRGTLTDGTVFDSSYDRGAPISLGVSQVIPGWTEALRMMKPGDKWLLHIPANLGYGSQAAGKIPPNSDLIFQVELLQVLGGL